MYLGDTFSASIKSAMTLLSLAPCDPSLFRCFYRSLYRCTRGHGGFRRAMQHRWLCHPPCLPPGRLRRLPRHRRRLAARETPKDRLGAPTGGLARPQGESRLTPAEPENAASVPVGTPSGVVSPLYTDTLNDESVLISFIIHERRAKSKARRTQEVFWFDGISHPALCEKTAPTRKTRACAPHTAIFRARWASCATRSCARAKLAIGSGVRQRGRHGRRREQPVGRVVQRGDAGGLPPWRKNPPTASILRPRAHRVHRGAGGVGDDPRHRAGAGQKRRPRRSCTRRTRR